MNKPAILVATVWIALASAPSLPSAPPTGWSPVVVPTGEYRAKIQAMPIEQRPGRLLHVYGNTIRYRRQQVAGTVTGRPVRRIVLGTDRIRP